MRIADHRCDFGAVANNARVIDESYYIVRRIIRYHVWIKVVADSSVMCPFAQHGSPTQPGLHGFRARYVRTSRVRGRWYAPLVVVVITVEWVIATPGTTIRVHGRPASACR
jgi:hypothetical protein